MQAILVVKKPVYCRPQVTGKRELAVFLLFLFAPLAATLHRGRTAAAEWWMQSGRSGFHERRLAFAGCLGRCSFEMLCVE